MTHPAAFPASAAQTAAEPGRQGAEAPVLSRGLNRGQTCKFIERSLVDHMMQEQAINLTFHGIGEPRRSLEPGESDFWVGHEQFVSLLDAVADRRDVRITFD